MSAPGWYADPLGRGEARYFDGTAWTARISRGGVEVIDPQGATAAGPVAATASANTVAPGMTGPGAAAIAGVGPSASPGTDPRLRKFGIAMTAIGGGIAVTAFFPWAESRIDSLSGFGWGPGRVTFVCGLVLAAYGAQVLVPDRSRVKFGGWAVTAIIISILVMGLAQSIVEDVDQLTLGVAGVEAGWGLLLGFFLSLAAIWPLVVLWKDDRRRAVLETYQRVQAARPGG